MLDIYNNSDIYYKIEFGIIFSVILYQIVHTIIVTFNIKALSGIFEHSILVENGYIERKYLKKPEKIIENIQYIFENPGYVSDLNTLRITITKTKGTNVIRLRITNAINDYLINNYGAVVNFNIIKDIIDREVDVKDEEIVESIPTPLYLGLAATMIGIIFGLIAMPAIDGSNFSAGITSLINGVKLAMFASLSGLSCTTILSSFFYKQAKKKVLKEKNKQLSYLLAKLLPELLKAEDSGVTVLKASLEKFAI